MVGRLIMFAIRAGYARGLDWWERLFCRGLLQTYPPAWMRFKVSGDPSLLTYVLTGRDTVEWLERLIGRSRYEWGTVYDLGCGCGRVMRYLPRGNRGGRDTDREAEGWCGEHLGMCDGWVGGAAALLCISVLSHCTPGEAETALADIGDLLVKGGVAVITTHDRDRATPHRSLVMSSYFSTAAYTAKEFSRMIELDGRLRVEKIVTFDPSPNQIAALVVRR